MIDLSELEQNREEIQGILVAAKIDPKIAERASGLVTEMLNQRLRRRIEVPQTSVPNREIPRGAIFQMGEK